MPTLGQVFDEVKESTDVLKEIRDDVQSLNESNTEISEDIKQLLTQAQGIESQINQVRTDMNSGFFNMSSGFGDLIKLGAYHSTLLNHQIEQNNTIICILERISEIVCGIHNESHQQTALQKDLREYANEIKDITATVHAGADLDLRRRKELERQISACCPSRPEPLVCIYRPCPAPDKPDETPPSLSHNPLPPPHAPEG